MSQISTTEVQTHFITHPGFTWRHMATWIWVSIGLGNGMALYQVITWTNVDKSWARSFAINTMAMLQEMIHISIIDLFENYSLEIKATSLRGQRVNAVHHKRFSIYNCNDERCMCRTTVNRQNLAHNLTGVPFDTYIAMLEQRQKCKHIRLISTVNIMSTVACSMSIGFPGYRQ